MLRALSGTLLAMLLAGATGAAANQVLGIPLNEPLDTHFLGASRDGAPTALTLHNSTILPQSAAATQRWTASQHWWFAEPKQLPERLRTRRRSLQIAVDQHRRPFWLILQTTASDCNAEQAWFARALAARYQVASVPDPIEQTQAPVDTLLYRAEDGSLLVSVRCQAQQLELEYLMPARYQTTYESSPQTPTPVTVVAAPPDAISTARATVLAEQSTMVLRGDREKLISWLGVALNADNAFTQNPGMELPFNLAATAFADLASHPLIAGAKHSLETDIAGGIARMTTVLPDASKVQQQRWRALLKARFGKPAKDSDKHQIYRFGDQRLVLRADANTLKIAYQNLARRKAERDRLAANKEALFQESIKGL